MLETERLLSERFASLRDDRAGPVFFIEHGLDEFDLERLFAAVREAVQRHRPASFRWREFPLPLIVCATEVGYRYRGSGTDFWPRLDSRLNVVLDQQSRSHIRDLFEICAEKYGGATPPNSPWASIFRLISWPITHALLPVEFHRELSAALANLGGNVREFDDPNLYRAVRNAAKRQSKRFANFLEDEQLVVPLIRALLGEADSRLSQDAVARILEDLDADAVVRRNMARARRTRKPARRSLLAVPAPRKRTTGQIQIRRHENGDLTMEALLPLVDDPAADRLRKTLRRRRFAPRLWGVSVPVPSEQFLSGLPFPLKLTSLPDLDAPLFGDLSALDEEFRPILESFQLEFRPPLLFAPNADGDVARSVGGLQISEHREYWLLVDSGSEGALRGSSRLGHVGPFACFSLDPADPHDRNELERRGHQVHTGFSFWFAGSLPMEDGAAVPRFLVGDERVVVPRRTHSPGTYVAFGSEKIPLGGDLIRVRVPAGEQFLEFSSPQTVKHETFHGLSEVPDRKQPLCMIECSAAEMTVQALFGGRIPIRIDGPVALEGLALTIEVEASGHRASVTLPLGPLPHNLPGDHKIWSTLLSDGMRERILEDPYPILHAHVGTLATESWTLERHLRPCWWVRDSSGITLQSESGPLEYGQVTVEEPAKPPTPGNKANPEEAYLLSPLGRADAELVPTADFTAYCASPDRLPLTPPRMRKPMLARQPKSTAESLGAEDLAKAWFRWALAESASPIADIRRRQVASQLDSWLAEITCGDRWVREEARMSASFADPWMLLSDELRETGIGRDGVIELSQRDESQRIRMAVAEVRREFPELWIRAGASSGSDDGNDLLEASDYEGLDLACARAYHRLAERYRNAGNNALARQLEEADPGAANDQWDRVLGRVKERSELRQLGELLLPTSTALRLTTLNLAFMPLSEIMEEFRRWTAVSALFARPPDDEILECALALWVAPEVAIGRDWRRALRFLLENRPLSRAARYLVLRARPGGAA